MDLESLREQRQSKYQQALAREAIQHLSQEEVEALESELVERWTDCQAAYGRIINVLEAATAGQDAEGETERIREGYGVKVEATEEAGRGVVTTEVRIRKFGDGAIHLSPRIYDETGYEAELMGESFVAGFDTGYLRYHVSPAGVEWGDNEVSISQKAEALGRLDLSIQHAEQETIPMLWGALHNPNLNPDAAAYLTSLQEAHASGVGI